MDWKLSGGPGGQEEGGSCGESEMQTDVFLLLFSTSCLSLPCPSEEFGPQSEESAIAGPPLQRTRSPEAPASRSSTSSWTVRVKLLGFGMNLFICLLARASVRIWLRSSVHPQQTQGLSRWSIFPKSSFNYKKDPVIAKGGAKLPDSLVTLITPAHYRGSTGNCTSAGICSWWFTWTPQSYVRSLTSVM